MSYNLSAYFVKQSDQTRNKIANGRFDFENLHAKENEVIFVGGKFPVVNFAKIANEHPKYELIHYEAGSFSCREALVSQMHSFWNVCRGTSFGTPVFVLSIDGYTKDSFPELLVLAEKFLSVSSLQIKADNRGYLRMIIYTANAAPMRLFFLASFLLYLARNRTIVNDAIENAQNGVNGLMKYLSQRFLEKLSWGDNYNPSLSLSLFAYAYYCGDDFMQGSVYSNGPVNAAYRLISPETVITYARTILLPKMKTSQETRDFVGSQTGGSRAILREIIVAELETRSLSEKLAEAEKKLLEKKSTRKSKKEVVHGNA